MIDNRDNPIEQGAPEELKEVIEAVEAVYKRLREEQDQFDLYLKVAVSEDLLEDYIESYLNMREAGLDFADAFLTAAEEREIELPKDEPKDE